MDGWDSWEPSKRIGICWSSVPFKLWSLKFKFIDLKKIKVFVLDEADVMIATQGHQDQSIRIQKNLSSECQMMLFSATYDTDVMNFAENIVSNPVIIRLRREEESLDNIGHYWVQCEMEKLKYNAIANIYGMVTIGKLFKIFAQCSVGKMVTLLRIKKKLEYLCSSYVQAKFRLCSNSVQAPFKLRSSSVQAPFNIEYFHDKFPSCCLMDIKNEEKQASTRSGFRYYTGHLVIQGLKLCSSYIQAFRYNQSWHTCLLASDMSKTRRRQ